MRRRSRKAGCSLSVVSWEGKGRRGVKLIVGLGNPGIEYQFTPHNAGFLAVDRIAEDCGVMLTNRRGTSA